MGGYTRLLCAFGRHAAAPGETWNGGYGFTKCRHCGRDLVRSMLDGWQVPPRGLRVAWRAVEPLTAAAHVTPAAQITAKFSAIGDFMDEAALYHARRPISPSPVAFDDFMSEAPAQARSTGTNGRP